MENMSKETTTKKSRSKKNIPVDAVQELADKSAQLAQVGNSIDGNATIEDGKTKLALNVDYLRTTKIHFAMPCYGGMLTESTFMSYIRFGHLAKQLGLEWTIETLVNESLISRARNTLTAKFLHHGTSTHLMFIDADIGWEAYHPLLLADRKVDVIGGMYPMKTLPLKWVVNALPGVDVDDTGLQEVSKAGTGFLLIKRDVFSKLRSHPAVKKFKNDIQLDPVYDQHLCTFFDTAVREGRYLSEDWTFCSNYRDLGGKIFIDKRVLLRHIGTYSFSLESQNGVLNTFKPLVSELLKKSQAES